MLVFPAFFAITTDARVNARVAAVRAPIGGVVRPFKVEEGDRVHAGDLLFSLVNDRVDETGLERLRAQRSALSSRLSAVGEEIQLHQRDRQLAQLGRIQARELTRNLVDVEEQLAREERRVGALGQANVRSPIDGEVLKRPITAGQLVEPGKALMVLVDPSTTVVEAWFHQRWLPEVKPGDRALVHLLGARGQLEGTVKSVQLDREPDTSYAVALPAADAKSFRAVIQLDEPAGLVAGQRAKVLLAGAHAGVVDRALMKLYSLGEL